MHWTSGRIGLEKKTKQQKKTSKKADLYAETVEISAVMSHLKYQESKFRGSEKV